MTSLPENWKLIPDAHGWIPVEPDYVHIVSAANRIGDVIFCGARHFSNAMVSQIKASNFTREEIQRSEQGFIDNYDRFWNREQAYEIMKITGQKMIEEDLTAGSQLFSENLY